MVEIMTWQENNSEVGLRRRGHRSLLHKNVLINLWGRGSWWPNQTLNICFWPMNPVSGKESHSDIAGDLATSQHNKHLQPMWHSQKWSYITPILLFQLSLWSAAGQTLSLVLPSTLYSDTSQLYQICGTQSLFPHLGITEGKAWKTEYKKPSRREGTQTQKWASQ